jgi:hypothetical protein
MRRFAAMFVLALIVAIALLTQAPDRQAASPDTSAPSVSTAAPAITPTRIHEVLTASASPAPTPMPPGGDPVALGADPRAGTIAGGELYGWRYDGRTGALTRDLSVGAGSDRSPSGHWRVEYRQVRSGKIIERVDLWLIDTASGAERLLYTPPERPLSDKERNVQPNLAIPPYVFQRTEFVLSWSPDERYLALWQIELVSASADADGRPVATVDLATGQLTQLGYMLYGYSGVWRAPHTLAFIAGAGRETWSGKALSVWSPETGVRALTAADEVGLAPTWAPDGRIWFASGPAGQYDVPTFFAGRGIGDRSVYALDIATGQRTKLPRIAGYADEGARVSDDERYVLINRRRLDLAARTGQSPNAWVELWIANVDGSDAKPLVKMSGVNGFGYYGGYGSLAHLDWVR